MQRTKEFRVEIGTIFKDEKRDITIIDREKRHKFKYGYKGHIVSDNRKWYKYRCNKCKHEGWIIEYSLLQGKGCPVCCDFIQLVVEGINDIPTTAPWMVKYFQGGYNEAKLYTIGSAKRIYPICSDCGEVKKNSIPVNKIYRDKSISCACSDKISYPEKFMYNFLKQLGIDFIYQLTKTNYKWCDNYRYDFYVPAINCIIETHGIQHYEESSRGRSLQEEQENDRLKKQLAKNNGINNYIVIDCRHSELEYIKNNILHSKLNKLFDLSNINWNNIEQQTLSNLIKLVCSFKNNNPNLTTTSICKEFGLARITVIKYLKKGTGLGWCNYVPNRYCKKTVEIFKDNVSLGIFESINELERQSEKLFGVFLDSNKISGVCTGKYKQYKGFTFRHINNNKQKKVSDK